MIRRYHGCMRIESILNSETQLISSAILDDRGRIIVTIADKRHRLGNTPKRVAQISLSSSGLACLDEQGRLYHLSGAPNRWTWRVDESVRNVVAIGCEAEGRLCALTQNTESSAPTVHVHSVRNGAEEWIVDASLTQWFTEENSEGDGARKIVRSRDRSKPSSRLRSRRFVLSMLFVLTLIPLAHLGWRVREQARRVRLIEASGARIRYAYEFDHHGNVVKDAQPSGAAWLRKRLGRHWFDRPVEAVNVDDVDHVVGLPTIRKLILKPYRNTTLKLSALEKHPNLEELVINSRQVKEFDHLSRFRNLKRLSLNGVTYQDQNVLRHIARCRQLESLTIDKANRSNIPKGELFGDLSPLAALANLRRLHLNLFYGSKIDFEPLSKMSSLEHLEVSSVQNLATIGQLKQLKSLTVIVRDDIRHDFHELAELTQLRSLTIRGKPMISDLAWVANMRMLRDIRLEDPSESSIDDLSPLHNLRDLRTAYIPAARNVDLELLFQRTHLNPASITTSVGSAYDASWRSIPILKLNRTHLKDLTFVANWPKTERLRANDNQIANIGPIAKLSDLSHVELAGTPLSDLSPLKELAALEMVDVSRTNVNDVSPLIGLRNLETLSLAESNVSDISPLANLQRLVSLDIRGTQVSDISAITNCWYLKELKLSASRVKELSSLAKLPQLERLECADLDIESVEVHPNVTKLKRLNMSGTQLRDLARLPNCGVNVDLSNTRIKDLRPLRDWHQLETLSLANTDVTDLSPLKDLRGLTSLDLSHTRVSDLTPLVGLGIRQLNLSHTNVSDLAAFEASAQLNRLDLTKTPVTSLSDLRLVESLYRLNLADTGLTDLNGFPRIRSDYRDSGELNLSGCPIDSLAGFVERFERIATLTLDCSQIDDLLPLAVMSELRSVTLENVQRSHRFEWLTKLRELRSLAIHGNEVDEHALFDAIGQTTNLRKLDLPAGVSIDFDRYRWMRNMEIRVGGERLRFINASFEQGETVD